MKKNTIKLSEIIIILLFLCQMTFSSRSIHDIQQSLFDIGNLIRIVVAPTCIILCLLYILKNGISFKQIPRNIIYIIIYWIIGAISFININDKWFLYSLIKYIEYTVMIVVIIYYSTFLVKKDNAFEIIFTLSINFFEFLLVSVLIGLFINPHKALFSETEFSELRNSVIPFVLRGHIITLSATMVGYISGILLFFYTVDYIEKKNKNKYNLFKISVFFVCFLVAQSRMAWIAFTIAVIWYIFIIKKNNILKIVCLNSIIITSILFREKIFRIILRGQSVQSFTSVTGRSKWWQHAINTFTETDLLRKLFGQGFASGEKIVVSQVSTVMGTMDSDYFGALTSVGIIGLIFMILFIIMSFFMIFKSTKYIKRINNDETKNILIKATGISIIILLSTFTVTSLGLLNYMLILLIVCSFTIEFLIRNINFKRSNNINNTDI